MQKPYIHEEKHDILLVAHGLILRCFWLRWLGLSIDSGAQLMFDPGAIGLLSYKHNNFNEPACHIGVQFP